VDWTGNENSIYKTLGASSHTDKEREVNDYYATDPNAIDVLFSADEFGETVWECACGEGHLSIRMEELGKKVISTDLIDRGYGKGGIDFLKSKAQNLSMDIITNPPYKYATDFIYKAMEILEPGRKAAMFLKLLFLESQERKRLFTLFPPKVLYVSSSRIMCAKNADFDGMKAGGGSAVAYGWFVWEAGYAGDTTIKWVN